MTLSVQAASRSAFVSGALGMQKTRDLEDQLINLAVWIAQVVENLPDSKLGNHISSQLIRSGTSPAPNYGEAQSAECNELIVSSAFMTASVTPWYDALRERQRGVLMARALASL